MAGFMAVAAQMVGAAVVQEAVSRTVSFTLGKRKEKLSQRQYLERLRKAVREVEFVLERTAKLPITEVSLLRDRMELKRDFIEAGYQLIRHKKRQALRGQQENAQAVTRLNIFSVSSLIELSKDELCLSCDNVKRFEQFADSARNILRDVESGCPFRNWMSFCSPPAVSHLFEWKTLIYTIVQADKERSFSMWPARLEEERGVEAHIEYKYVDHKRPEKSFSICFVLRLSESTNIVGVAMNCLQSLASQFKLVADTAIGELTVLADLQDVSHSHAPPVSAFKRSITKLFRSIGHIHFVAEKKGMDLNCANNIIASELSHIFPEEVTFFKFEYSLCNSADAAGKGNIMRNGRPCLALRVCLVPHYVHEERLQASYAAEVIGDSNEECIDVSIQQMGARDGKFKGSQFFLKSTKGVGVQDGLGHQTWCCLFLCDKKKLRADAVKTSGRSKV